MSDTSPAALALRLDGFEGPLDLLLDLARAQKVDLARISILALVEQYLAVIEGAVRVRLELAADWLVMAAWLAWLKSRLLLPQDDPAAEEGAQSAELLAARLAELAAMRAGAAWLGARPVLGIDVFRRGAAEDLTATDRSRLVADLPALLQGYVAAMRRGAARVSYQPKQLSFWTMQDALGRLAADPGFDAGLDHAGAVPARRALRPAAPRGHRGDVAGVARDGTQRRVAAAAGCAVRADPAGRAGA